MSPTDTSMSTNNQLCGGYLSTSGYGASASMKCSNCDYSQPMTQSTSSTPRKIYVSHAPVKKGK